MGLRIYNTLTRRKEEFSPVTPGKVGIYLCGPTVYKKSHIGHAVGPVIFDAIRRWLEVRHGYEVTLVLNVTDVDDKLIEEAKVQNRPMEQIAEEVTEDYLNSLRALGVRMPTYMPKATEHIDDIIKLIERLIDGGSAYQADGDVYFDVTKFGEYGKLSGRTVEQQSAGTRELQSAEGKRHEWDFALWKAAREGEPSWQSPWGAGRPGWHIECSAMSMKYLGETFDIHGGGVDLVFPHHENEIAQSEAATGKPFVKYWLHNGLTRISTRKMSKSLGNIRGIGELLERYPGEVLRFFILSTHYRRPIDFSDEEIAKVTRGVQTFYRLFERCTQITGENPYEGRSVSGQSQFDQASAGAREFLDEVADRGQKFSEAMDDDFNTAEAIANLYGMANAANRYIERARLSSQSSEQDKDVLLTGVSRLIETARILGLFESPPEQAVSDELAEQLIELLIEVRSRARRDRQFGLADMVRDRLGELGIQLKDGREGTTWEKAS